MQNRLLLTATVEREEALRVTPAGVPVLEVWLRHQSRQTEAGIERDVACEIQAVIAGEKARQLSGRLSGCQIEAQGFVCQRSLDRKSVV